MSLPDRAHLHARLQTGLAELGVPAGVDASERLLDYLELLSRWNAVYNLTAVRDPGAMVERHLLDSLSIAPFVQGDSLADLGSGAGLPGIPLAILAPEREHVLIDSNGKKVRFLREAVRTLGLANARVEQVRVEDARGHYACITARAFATLGEMLTLGGHLLGADGVWLALKGLLKKEEVLGVPAGFVVADVKPLRVPGLAGARHVAIIKRSAAQEHAA